MKFGFGTPTRGPLATPENLITLAQRGQHLGFDIIGVSDHVVIPKNIASRYPYSESGQFPGAEDYMEQLTAVAYLAGLTSNIRLLTSVLVLPHRPPVLTAKMLATIDVLSGGRLVVGCGVGWMREEFEALGAPPYDERGAVGDEYVRAFKKLWTSETPSFDGKYCTFSDISFMPKPIQKPHPPIWVGGESPAALRRAAELGDAWYPIGNNPRHPVQDPQRFKACVQRIHRYAQAAGRDPSQIDLAYNAGWYNDREAQIIDGERRVFTGTPSQVAGDIKAFGEVGVRHIMLGFQADTLHETLERMERFANNVKPLTQG